MGFFDWYEPSGEFCCATCGKWLDEWQGTGAACGMFVWRQGEAAPVSQQVDNEVAIDPTDREKLRIPDGSVIYSFCEDHHQSWSTCIVWEGTWVRTTGPARHRPPSKSETRAERRARLRED